MQLNTNHATHTSYTTPPPKLLRVDVCVEMNLHCPLGGGVDSCLEFEFDFVMCAETMRLKMVFELLEKGPPCPGGEVG